MTREPILEFFTVHGYESSLVAYASSVDQWMNHLDEKARGKAREKAREKARKRTREEAREEAREETREEAREEAPEEARQEAHSKYGATQEDDGATERRYRAAAREALHALRASMRAPYREGLC